MSVLEFTDLGVVEVLNAALAGKFGRVKGSNERAVTGKDTFIGVVESHDARKIYHACRELKRAHALIQKRRGKAEELKRIEYLLDPLEKIWKQGIGAEHPLAATNACELKEGWKLFCPSARLKEPLEFKNPDNIFREFIHVLKDILKGEELLDGEASLEPMAPGERVIGMIRNRRTRSLWALPQLIRQDQSVELPGSPFRSVIEGQGRLLTQLSVELAWEESHREVPAIGQRRHGLRQEWQVVEKPPAVSVN